MRIAIERLGAHPHPRKELRDTIFLVAATRQSMYFEALADDRPYPHPRIERGVGILKNELHLAAELAQFGSRKRREVATIIEDLTGRRLDQLQNQPPQRRFAGAGFTYQPDRFAPHNLQVDTVNRLDREPLAPEQILRAGGKFLAQPDTSHKRAGAGDRRLRRRRIRRGCRRHNGPGLCVRAAVAPSRTHRSRSGTEDGTGIPTAD